jgi:hypothetical protein
MGTCAVRELAGASERIGCATGRTIAGTSQMKPAVVSKWMLVRIAILYSKQCEFPERLKTSTKTRCNSALNNYCPYKHLLVFVSDQITGKYVWARTWSFAGHFITQKVKYNLTLIYVLLTVNLDIFV